MSDTQWTPDQPLRWPCTAEQMRERGYHLAAYYRAKHKRTDPSELISMMVVNEAIHAFAVTQKPRRWGGILARLFP